MAYLNVDFETLETTLLSFDRIAERFSKDILLKINSAFYRLVDFEFYTYSNSMPDPHTYQNGLQLKNGKLYLHGSGIDITCGDGINHCGILLRSAIKLNEDSGPEMGFMEKQYDGPQVLATELFANLNPFDSNEKNEISLLEISRQDQAVNICPPIRIIKTKRVGLTPKLNDQEDFYLNLPVRYIVILPGFSKFKQKIKGIESVLVDQVTNGLITEEEAVQILGYKRKLS